MARLPTPGSDNGTWGTVLNDFLSQAHDSDGSLKTTAIQDGTITTDKLDSTVQNTLNNAVSEVAQDKQWIITGPINVAAADVDYIAPAFIPVPTGLTATITALYARINSGTNVTLRIERNGSILSGLGSVNVTTTGTTIANLNLPLLNGDLLAPVVTSTSGGPQNMTVMISYKLTKA